MTEQKIQKFLYDIFSKKFYKKYRQESDTYKTNIIEEQGRTIFEEMFRKFISENENESIGILEAKVFAYEKIISNSNFAPLIKEINNP